MYSIFKSNKLNLPVSQFNLNLRLREATNLPSSIFV
jgi:hypothetical protein